MQYILYITSGSAHLHMRIDILQSLGFHLKNIMKLKTDWILVLSQN
jgi:hypothetical protein